MEITNKRLRQIIKEELLEALGTTYGEKPAGMPSNKWQTYMNLQDYERGLHGFGSHASKSSLDSFQTEISKRKIKDRIRAGDKDAPRKPQQLPTESEREEYLSGEHQSIIPLPGGGARKATPGPEMERWLSPYNYIHYRRKISGEDQWRYGGEYIPSLAGPVKDTHDYGTWITHELLDLEKLHPAPTDGKVDIQDPMMQEGRKGKGQSMKLIMESWRRHLVEADTKVGGISDKTASEFEKLQKAKEEEKKKMSKSYKTTSDAFGDLEQSITKDTGDAYKTTTDAFGGIEKSITDTSKAIKDVEGGFTDLNKSTEETGKSFKDAQTGFGDLEKASKETGKAVSGVQTGFEDLSAASEENADKFAKALAGLSKNVQDDAKTSQEFQKSYTEREKEFDSFKEKGEGAPWWEEFSKKYEELGLEDFMQKIEKSDIEIEDFFKAINTEDAEILKQVTDSLEKAGVKPEEVGDKFKDAAELKDEFEKYREEQEKATEEQEKADKEASMEETNDANAAEDQEQKEEGGKTEEEGV